MKTLIEWHRSMAGALTRATELRRLEFVIDAYVDCLLPEEYGTCGHGWCVVGMVDAEA